MTTPLIDNPYFIVAMFGAALILGVLLSAWIVLRDRRPDAYADELRALALDNIEERGRIQW